MRRMLSTMLLFVGLLGWMVVTTARAQLSTAETQTTIAGSVTVINVPSTGGRIDYVNAQPMKLPGVPPRSDAEAVQDLIQALTSPPTPGVSGYAPGWHGNGERNPINLGIPAGAVAGVEPEEFGTSNHAFSTARADLNPASTNTSYPYRAAGKLFFNIGSSTFLCSASLIKRGVVVTAAHCVSKFGANQIYSNWHFVPGYRNGAAPFGNWTAKEVFVLTSYLNGTDPCAQAGVVCRDDVALLLLNTSATGAYPGTATGWYGFGFNGFGFTGSHQTEISQIGYPGCLDNGALMERNDSSGFVSAANSNNTVIGSLMCGGSSGGPWVINLGIRPALTGTTAGTASTPNVVVGVTSWGSTSNGPKEQGASPFLSGNIGTLVNAACAAVPGACS